MSDFEKILYTAAATIIGGTIIYVIGQVLSKRAIDPCNELRKAISEVKFTLSFFAQEIHTPISRNQEKSTEAAKALKAASSRLFALIELIPENRFLRFISFTSLPADREIQQAAVELRVLAQHVYQTGEDASRSIDEVNRRIDKVKKLLRFSEDPAG